MAPRRSWNNTGDGGGNRAGGELTQMLKDQGDMKKFRKLFAGFAKGNKSKDSDSDDSDDEKNISIKMFLLC